MHWVAGTGILAVAAAAALVASRQGPRWPAFFGAGAAGWVLAQAGKAILIAPVTIAAIGHGAASGGSAAQAAAASALATRGWFVAVAALVPGVVEELGKYVPLRWMRAATRPEALALGLGAGAVEALTLVASLVVAAGGSTGAMAAVVPVWERFWSVALHAGMAAFDGLAVATGRLRWLMAAMAAHALVDAGAGWYQHAVAVGGPRAQVAWALGVTEVGVAVVAIAVWWVGRRAWSRVGRSGATASG